MIIKNDFDGFYTLLIKEGKYFIAKNLCESTSTRRKQVQKIGIDKESIGYLLEFVKISNDFIYFKGFLATSNCEAGLVKSLIYRFSVADFLQYKANYKGIK